MAIELKHLLGLLFLTDVMALLRALLTPIGADLAQSLRRASWL